MPNPLASFETLVVEKGHLDLLQFLSNPEQFRRDVDLPGLTNSARESFTTVKLWQQAAGCLDHPLVQTTITDIVEQSNKLHSAIKLSLTIAKQGHTFSNDVVAFYGVLFVKDRSPERLHGLYLHLNKIAEKAFKRSKRSCDELKEIREMLFQIAKGIASKASEIEQDMLNRRDRDIDDTPVNGINACFITFPRNLATSNTDTWPLSNLYLGSQPEDDEESDDENTIASQKRTVLTSWTSYPKPKHMSFANVEAQLIRIAQGILPFIEHFNRYAFWWGTMKDGLEGLKDALPQLMLDRPVNTTDLVDGWKGVGDQFALYVYKTTPIVTDYIPNQRHPGQQMLPRLPLLSPLRPETPPTIYPTVVPNTKAAPMAQKDKPKPLWKRLACVI